MTHMVSTHLSGCASAAKRCQTPSTARCLAAFWKDAAAEAGLRAGGGDFVGGEVAGLANPLDDADGRRCENQPNVREGKLPFSGIELLSTGTGKPLRERVGRM
jgi:hypothetical protein